MKADGWMNEWTPRVWVSPHFMGKLWLEHMKMWKSAVTRPRLQCTYGGGIWVVLALQHKDDALRCFCALVFGPPTRGTIWLFINSSTSSAFLPAVPVFPFFFHKSFPFQAPIQPFRMANMSLKPFRHSSHALSCQVLDFVEDILHHSLWYSLCRHPLTIIPFNLRYPLLWTDYVTTISDISSNLFLFFLPLWKLRLLFKWEANPLETFAFVLPCLDNSQRKPPSSFYHHSHGSADTINPQPQKQVRVQCNNPVITSLYS